MKLSRNLEPPSYGYTDDLGQLVVPSRSVLFKEFLSRMNIFKTRKNWLPLFSWLVMAVLTVPLYLFLTKYFSWWLVPVGFTYSMIVLGTHGTIWYHRYSTHRAYTFKNAFWRFITKNLVIEIFPEELYVVSHHVHHNLSEQPGDPYNVNCGWWYCFLADAIHQPIARDLSPSEYKRVAAMINHTGVKANTYEQYQKWGSICHPLRTIIHFAINWSFWYGVFFLIGGHALATCIFGASSVWAFGIRTFNYSGHGDGKDKQKEGIDFDKSNKSINQAWPGLITGEWHNNHHLYPNGARAGFLPYQFDPAWYYIKLLHAFGGITSYKDYKQQFLDKHYLPYQASVKLTEVSA